jgi:hypothetical protein
MTAAASLRDSSSVIEADLGKGRVMPQRTATCLPLPLHPSPKEKAGGQSRPQNLMPICVSFSTPSHFCTAQRGGYASTIPAAGVAFVAEAISVSGKWPCQPCAVWIRTKGAFGAPCGTHRPMGISSPLGVLDRPMRMVCSGTASGQGSTLAIPALSHICGIWSYLRRQILACEIGYNRV